jgi:hypothetical protein
VPSGSAGTFKWFTQTNSTHSTGKVFRFTRASGEMADALASGASKGNLVGVQVPPRPPTNQSDSLELAPKNSVWVLHCGLSGRSSQPRRLSESPTTSQRAP